MTRTGERRRPAKATAPASEAQYRRIFESVNDALFIFDFQGRVVDCNPASQRVFGHTVEEFRGLMADQFVHPDSRPDFARFWATVRMGREFRGRGVMVRKDGTTFHAEARGAPFEYGGRPHVLGILRDISEEVAAYQLLEHRVEERTRELSTLLDISRDVVSTLALRELLQLVLRQLNGVVDYSGAAIFTLENGRLTIVDYEGPLPREHAMAGHQDVVPGAGHAAVIQRREPVIIPDIWGDTPEARAIQAAGGGPLKTDYGHIHSWMGVPLMVKDRLIGLLSLDHPEPDRYTAQHARLALAFANHAAVAVENARLFEAEQRRAEQFRVIGEIGSRITSILSVEELLAQTARLIRETFGYHHVHIGLIEGDMLVFRTSLAAPDDEPFQCCEAVRIRVGRDGTTGWVAGTGEPLLTPDVSREPRYVGSRADRTRSEIVVPLKVKGKVVGVMDVESDRLNAFDQSDLTVLQSLASQVAVATENARLYEQAQRLAALEERQRLARELHDSVSQALYGIALGARTARTQLDRDPRRAAEPLDYVLSLSEAALAEMRALIFELRPESLEMEGLVAALLKQAASLRARHHLDVHTAFDDEPEAPLETKQALYRIAQEALHNTVKHARAGRVNLRLHETGTGIAVEVDDDGLGFDAGGSFPGHLGLRSMRERAERLGGTLEVESTPGAGTRVRAHIPR